MTNPLPVGCTDRYNEIIRRASELRETFANGNRKDAVQALEEMEPRAALAVLSEMMVYDRQTRVDLNRFLKEVA